MAEVTVRPAGIRLALRPGETILAGLHRAGYTYRIGCRRGGCGICKAEVVDGEVPHRGAVADEALPPEPECLTCRAVPVSDVVIHLPDDARLRCVAPLLAGIAGVSTTPPSTKGER